MDALEHEINIDKDDKTGCVLRLKHGHAVQNRRQVS